MLERIRNYALYGDTDLESYNAVKGRLEEYNRKIAFVFASVAFLLISIMFILSLTQEPFSDSMPVYLYGIFFSVVQIFISLLARRMPGLSYLSVYMAVSVFMIYGIAIAVLTRPQEQTVTFMVLLIFVPMIFVDRPIRMAGAILFFVVIFIWLVSEIKHDDILFVDVTDALIFGVLAVISETVVYRAKIKGYVLEHRLHIMSETDQLTGVNNRNCYELRLLEYASRPFESICCVYIDVNGLHELNNRAGHKAGDDMLCAIAAAVTRQFGRNDVYRVGGDEYVAFAFDMTEHEIVSRLDILRDEIEGQGYNAALGYEYSKDRKTDINKLIVDAETKMYKNKSDYYRSHDRRLRK